MKTIIPRDEEGHLKEEETCWQRIFYIRDAQGNVMATMEQRPVDECEPVLYMDNFYVYGSSRLGKEKKSDIEWNDLENGWQDSIFVSVMEEKSYELSNHLGNVHITLSDYRRKKEDDQGEVTYFSQVKSASDYYPFGQLLTEGNYSAEDYRFGFNGKEMDNEVKGTGNSYDFGARLYSPRIGRWMAVDPLADDFPSWTTYHYCHANPVGMVDPLGMSADWFQNERTGDVYYHPTMSKGDEGSGAMKGEGWEHMGENGMFGSGDQVVIMNNSDKADVTMVDLPVVDPATSEETGETAPMRSAMFKGDNAKSFMGEQGYNFKAVLFKYHSDITTESHPESHGQVTITHDNSHVEGVLSSRYVHQDMVLKKTLTLKNYKLPQNDPPKSYGPMYSIRNQSWTYRKNVYGTHALGRKAGKTFKTLEKIVPWKSIYEDLWKKK